MFHGPVLPHCRAAVLSSRALCCDVQCGVDRVVAQVTAALRLHLECHEFFADLDMSSSCGAVLHGPSGTGKTTIASQVAASSGFNVLVAHPATLRSKVVGESERAIVALFAKALACRPCVVLLDQLETLVGRSAVSSSAQRLTTCLLAEMDRAASSRGVFLLGTTNALEAVDPAVLGPGRLEHHFRVELPNVAARRQILASHLAAMQVDPLADFDGMVSVVAKQTKGFSGADLEALCVEAGMLAIRDNVAAPRVSDHHISAAVDRICHDVSCRTAATT
eukprot:m.264689 g.264689  ORF g.264689 m.264689 type:complete len:278 (-) comp19252_c0_seq1:128-961(-)